MPYESQKLLKQIIAFIRAGSWDGVTKGYLA